jgi:predicted nucleotide-binding protein (sugar kinase/HSP70/actin superfamily)
VEGEKKPVPLLMMPGRLTMVDSSFKKARFSSDEKYVIDKNGNKLQLNDPRVIHVWTMESNPYQLKMIEQLFHKRAWHLRVIKKPIEVAMKDAKHFCTGRECFFSNYFAGAVYNDLMDHGNKDEVTLYYYAVQRGPCQIGAWPDMFEIMRDRLKMDNSIFLVNLNERNNYLGQGVTLGKEIASSLMLGDIFREAEYSLTCVAVDPQEAMKTYQAETEKVLESIKNGLKSLKIALSEWAKAVANIPVKKKVSEMPKILVLGTVEVEILHHPVVQYFISQGIIPKVTNFTQFPFIMIAENYIRYGFKRGKIALKDHMKIFPFMLNILNPKTDHKEYLGALGSFIGAKMFDVLMKKYHKIASASGLLCNEYISMEEICVAGDRFASVNTFTESFEAIGSYLMYSKSGAYDGLMHLCSFNCQPAVNAQAIIRSHSSASDIPFASIDMEGPWLSSGQIRTLETLAVQAKSSHGEKHGLN